MTNESPEEAIQRELDGLLQHMLTSSTAQEFADAQWWLVELRDPTTGFVTRCGFWGRDEQDEAVAEAMRLEHELNDGLPDDATPFECTVVPVFGRD